MGGFRFQYDGKHLDIDDVPLDVYINIEEETKISWIRLQRSPQAYAKAGSMLAYECAKIVGVELPPLTPRTFVDVFDIVEEENRPTEYSDGIPDPKAQGSEPETT